MRPPDIDDINTMRFDFESGHGSPNVLAIADLRFITSALRSRADVSVHFKAAEHLRAMAIACRNLVEFPVSR
jgi:hypothetical protein